MNYQQIRGVIVPMLTPLTENDKLNLEAAEQLIEYLIATGVHGLFPLGTTGEGPLCSLEERQTFAKFVVDTVNSRIPVIVHTGGITTSETKILTEHASDIGANAAAVIPSYYFQLTQDALAAHFIQVANHTPDFPIYLYNNPGVAGNPISLQMVQRVVEACSNVVGIKDSGGTLDVLFHSRKLLDGKFNTASGPDGMILASFALGIDACVSGNANIFPELVVSLYNAASRGDLETARKLQEKLDRARVITKDGADLSIFKGILSRRGLPIGKVRQPLLQAPESVIDACWQKLVAEGFETIQIA